VECDEGSVDVPATLDGTWQKHGQTCLNSVVSAKSRDTGKVLTTYCQVCVRLRDNKRKPKVHRGSGVCKVNCIG